MESMLRKYKILIRQQFAEKILEEIEEDFGILISDSVYDDIMILAEDLTFGSGAEKTGSSEFFYLEEVIYDIVAEKYDL